MAEQDSPPKLYLSCLEDHLTVAIKNLEIIRERYIGGLDTVEETIKHAIEEVMKLTEV